eukprot:COSAG02_NODE_1094_length_14603_cov_40.760549_12_plen_59_part_00
MFARWAAQMTTDADVLAAVSEAMPPFLPYHVFIRVQAEAEIIEGIPPKPKPKPEPEPE